MTKDISHCLVLSTSSIFKLEEKRAKATFDNKKNENYWIYNNDECVMKDEGRRADFVVCHDVHGDLIVELKGRSVEDAVKQIAATYEYWRVNKLFKGPRQAALVVCKQVPHALSAQKAQNDFSQKYKTRIRVMTRCEHREIKDLL